MLTNENYYQSTEYMSVSLFKAMQKCPACAMAQLRGEWKPEKSKSLLLGSFVDEALTGTEESMREFLFKNEHDIFKKGGGKYAEFVQAEETIERIKQQPLMMHYLSGEHQRIMTGSIANVPFKGKFDSYKPGEFIADLKYARSLRSPNMFQNFVDYWRIPLQGAVYQELVFQNTRKRLPFYLVIATKEQPAHLAVCEINQYNLDKALEEVKRQAPLYWRMVNGEEEAYRCREYDCDYCTTTEVLTEPIDHELLGMSKRQIDAMNGVM